MTHSQRYAAAVGRTPKEEDPTEPENAAFEQQQYNNWLEDPYTKSFIQFLIRRANVLHDRAVKGANNGVDNKWVIRDLNKEQSIIEVLDYARDRKSPSGDN
jgi:hypothetical protein